MSQAASLSPRLPQRLVALSTARHLGALVVALMLAVGALTSWIFLRTKVFDPQAHFAYSTVLQALREADTKVNAELMASRLEWVHDYDRLNAGIAELSQASRRAAELPAFLPPGHRDAMAPRVKALQDIVAHKADLIDHFRRDHAVARNSLALFPELADDLRGRWSSADQMAVLEYVNSVLLFARTPSADRLSVARQLRQQLAQRALLPTQVLALAPLLQHGQMIVDAVGRSSREGQDAMDLGLALQLAGIDRSYVQGHAAAEARSERFRRLMLLMNLGTVAALALTFVRLDRARRALATAHREVSERFAAQQKAEAELKLHATAFLNAHEGITLTDAERRIVDVNPAFTRITGFERSEVIGRNPRVLKSGRHDHAFYQEMWSDLAKHGTWRGEIWNRNKYGEVYPELLSISSVHDAQGQLTNYVAIFSDISRLKEQERQLTQMAYYDPLTNLPNRSLLADRMQQALAQTRRARHALLAVCYLDLDGFKPINDNFGHEMGDRVLVEIAERLQANLRTGDTVARLGGDEFVVLMLNLNGLEHCHQVLQRLQSTLSMPLKCLPQADAVSASIGVTVYPNDDSDVDTLLRHADQAMYQAKQANKGCYHLFDPAQDQDVRTRQDSLKRIADALRLGELTLYYQPKVNMRSGVVVGAEALIRWQHPERGLLAPGDFLPLIDDHELIVDVGQWVIDRALDQMVEWQQQGLWLDVSVNVASRQLEHPDFLRRLRASLSRHPDLESRLELEILETATLRDIAQVSHVIADCQALGVNVAIDDFGTGYSSLTYLKRLPAQTIKIDRSFVGEMVNDHNNLVIVQGVLGLARSFMRTAVAEGVESVDHGRMLLQLGCDLGQGYGIARPMPAQAVASWVAQWQWPPAWQRVSRLCEHPEQARLLLAEVEHCNWTAKLLYAIREGQPVPRDNLADHHQCRFGQWYDSAATQPFAQLDAFRAIAAPHRRVHELAAEMDSRWRKGQHAGARELLAPLERERDAVLAAIRALQENICSVSMSAPMAHTPLPLPAPADSARPAERDALPA